MTYPVKATSYWVHEFEKILAIAWASKMILATKHPWG